MTEIEALNGDSAEVEVVYLIAGAAIALKVDVNQPAGATIFLEPAEAERLAVALIEAASTARSMQANRAG